MPRLGCVNLHIGRQYLWLANLPPPGRTDQVGKTDDLGVRDVASSLILAFLVVAPFRLRHWLGDDDG